MHDRYLRRIGACAALAGAAAQLVASLLEPDWGGEPTKAIRVVAENASWNGDRLLDLIGLFLTVAALTIVTRTLVEGPGRAWVRLGSPFLVLIGALGASAVATGHGMKEVADAWAGAVPQARPAYLAAFETVRPITDALYFGAFLALGIFLAALSSAILVARTYPRWIGWVSALGAVFLVSGDLFNVVFDAAFVAVLAGFVLFLVVQVALGVSLWRLAAVPTVERRASPATAARAA